MPSDAIITQLRLLGARSYITGMHQAATAVSDFDTRTGKVEKTAGRVGGAVDNMARKIVSASWNIAQVGAVGAGAAVVMGLKFDAAMERAEIGMESLLKSGKLAKRTVENVRDFALKAPLFGVEQMMTSAQQLIGAGYDAKKIVPTLTKFSDTLSAMGRKPEDLQRITYAFVQMMSKGQISAEELRGQLGEIFPAQKLLAKEMGISSRDLAKKMKEGAVKGKKPIIQLLEAMEKEFGGATDKMAETFDGQLANIKEQAKFTLGTLFQPLFVHLEKDVFPAVATFATEWQKTLANTNMTSEQKWARTQQLARIYLKPIAEDAVKWIKEADIPGVLVGVLDEALPVAMDTAADMAPKIAKSFVHAWWEADIWTKLFTLSLLMGKVGLFKTVGEIAAKRFVTRFTATTVAAEQLTLFDTAGKKSGNRWGKTMGKWAGRAAVAGVILFLPQITRSIRDAVTEAMPAAAQYSGSKGWGELWRDTIDRAADLGKKLNPNLDPFGHRFGGGSVMAGRAYRVGENGPELFVPQVSGRIEPNLNLSMPNLSGAFTIHSYTVLDGRVAARSVARHEENRMARR